ncbi:hypothetical protein MmiEs2_10480 [Methanimicrococcus stummii]|uniref:Uncharacterized protein n=1 Tax=Methanimicrococcus stummii TaxID=3028294 RepID=A0AA96VAQ7_9EURY|nr:hypothetical protein [Methanimicrococcus sp. Es2]WNY28840.1 hypothetical protein MmiEs2_10480 [Methanimicrococcus sp. Es2]
MNRQQELSFLLLDYLTDWTETESDLWTIEKSKEEIKLYGSDFDEPNDKLVKSCLRHFIFVINPWNEEAIPDLIKDMGFTKSEIDLYWEHLYL